MLHLPSEIRTGLEALVQAAYPHEACGVLVGRSRLIREAEVVRAVPIRNLETERAADRFSMDPAGLLEADSQARREGLTVVGVWHSHPDHPAVPSETDLKAAWAGWSYLIASVNREGVEELRSWRLEDQTFKEEPIS